MDKKEIKEMREAIIDYASGLSEGFITPYEFIKTIGRKYISTCDISNESRVIMTPIEDFFENIPDEFKKDCDKYESLIESISRDERLLAELDLPEIKDGQYFTIDWADDNRYFTVAICQGASFIGWATELLDSKDFI